MCPGNAFDCRMIGFRHIHVAGDKALLLRSLHLVVMGIPCGANRRVILGKLTVHAENQIAALHEVVQAVSKGGVISCFLGVPLIKERKQRRGNGGVYVVEKLMVKFGAGLEAFFAALRLGLCVHTQHIGGVVPQKNWDDSA